MRHTDNNETKRWFTQLYHETARDILAYLLRRCATAEDAADALAETYATAWVKRDRIPHGTQARPWLFGVARNVMHRSHDQHTRANATARQLAAALTTALPAIDTGLETSGPVHEALTRLSAIDQEIVTLVAWDGLSPADVAEILQMSTNLVRVRLHRARAKLRGILSSATLGSLTDWLETAETSQTRSATAPAGCPVDEHSRNGHVGARYLPQMPRIGIQRDTLAGMPRSHGEDDLAARVDSLSDDQMARIGTLGAYYAWSEDALAFQGAWAVRERCL